MRSVGALLLVNLLLAALAAVGLGAALALWRLIQLAGLGPDAEAALWLPIGAAAVFAMYYAGRAAHRIAS